MIQDIKIPSGPAILTELLCPDLVHLYRIRFKCVRDPRRLIWATTKTTSLMWLFLTLVVLSGNTALYSYRWGICSKPMKRISATVVDWERDCLAIKENRTVLPVIMRPNLQSPLIYQIVVIALITLCTYYSVLTDNPYLSHLCGYALANIWHFDIYQNLPALMAMESVLYTMALIFQLIAFCTIFLFCGSLHSGFQERRPELYPFGTYTEGCPLISPSFHKYVGNNSTELHFQFA